MVELNKIYNGDCEELIKQLDNNSIDLSIQSPPYNVDLGKSSKFHNVPYDTYNDNKDHKEYIQWLKNIFELLYDKMKVGGRIVINIGDGANGKIPTASDIIHFMSRELKYIPFANIIWDKNGQSSNRCAWGSWMQPSSPSFPMTFEHILIFCKESLKLQHKGVTDITREEFITYTNSLWKMTPQTNMKKKYNHGAMFPEELPYRCIKMLSYVGDVVLDCFNGAGTTTFVANKLNRKYIGFELSEKYCATAQERIDKYNKEKEI